MVYLYMIYTDTLGLMSLTGLYAKISIGYDEEYRNHHDHYTNYSVYLLQSSDYGNVIDWCIEKGYIDNEEGLISISIDMDQSLRYNIDRYNDIIHDIYTYMCSLGTVYSIDGNDPLPASLEKPGKAIRSSYVDIDIDDYPLL